ncbi:4'-phosphopantetheinyl transferase superfamily protein [Streptomyces sp. NPDC047315]|uniref:4'-phosphopantetheinyl transferase family protein n=1 Tax=Streptomyces sp. NPDC047315 TaxID=3155142 RepID=UPI0033ECA94B
MRTRPGSQCDDDRSVTEAGTDAGDGPRAVEVWWARAEDAHDGLVSLLDQVERARYAATTDPASARRFLVGCAVSRLVLGGRLGLPAADVPLKRVCPRCGGPHGKVALDRDRTPPTADVRFSVTHGGDTVGVAFCHGAEVGLDVEEIAQFGSAGAGAVAGSNGDREGSARNVAVLAPRVLTATELAALHDRPRADLPGAFLRYWVRKEAVLKAWGTGLHVPLRQLEVSAPEQHPEVVGWPERDGLPHELSMADTVVLGRHPAAVCVIGRGGVALRERDAGPALRDVRPPR